MKYNQKDVKETVMKQKIGTIIEEEILKLAKHQALEERRPLSDVIQEAIVSYLHSAVPNANRREKAYKVFCEQPMRLGKKQFKQLLKEDVWGL